MFQYYEKEVFSLFNEYNGMTTDQKNIARMDSTAQRLWDSYDDEKKAEFLVEGVMRIFFLQGVQPFKLKKTRQNLLRRVQTEDAKYLVQFCFDHVKVESTMNQGNKK